MRYGEKKRRYLLIGIASVTFFAILYVHQQTEVMRLAYVNQKAVAQFEDCLEKNAFLRYNLERKISLIRIGEKVAAYANLQMPAEVKLVQMNVGSTELTSAQEKKGNIFTSLLGIKRVAEAEPVNP